MFPAVVDRPDYSDVHNGKSRGEQGAHGEEPNEVEPDLGQERRFGLFNKQIACNERYGGGNRQDIPAVLGVRYAHADENDEGPYDKMSQETVLWSGRL
ncbi:MAG: hypothetical protein J7M40_15555 [Planctomycetes bacterium]|nr:hypothetical protein [Planctomycetota bacterium]